MKQSVILKTLLIFALIAAFIGSSGEMVGATPSSQALYLETYLEAEGIWRYDYILYNTSDPGNDIYDFALYFAPEVTFMNILSPPDWFSISGSGDPSLPSFIEWYSDFGAEITPGNSLSGFSFQINYQAGDIPFDIYLTDPSGEPSLYSGTTTPVPEPATLFLLGSGLVGLLFLRAKRLFIH